MTRTMYFADASFLLEPDAGDCIIPTPAGVIVRCPSLELEIEGAIFIDGTDCSPQNVRAWVRYAAQLQQQVDLLYDRIEHERDKAHRQNDIACRHRNEVERLREENARLEADNAALELKLAERNHDLEVMDRWVEEQREEISGLRECLQARDEGCAFLTQLLAATEYEKDRALQDLNEQLDDAIDDVQTLADAYTELWQSGFADGDGTWDLPVKVTPGLNQQPQGLLWNPPLFPAPFVVEEDLSPHIKRTDKSIREFVQRTLNSRTG